MTPLRFGLVKEVQFVNSKGQPQKPERLCNLAAELNMAGDLSTPPYGVFSMGGTCGDPNSKFYVAYNGPEDTDGDTFSREAIAINDKYAKQWPLSDEARANLVTEKTALFQSYLDRVSGTVQIKTKLRKTFEFLNP